MKHQENKTYELVPDDGGESWYVRIKEGMFSEAVIQFGAIKIGKELDEGDHQITFDFDLISSPDGDLNVEDEELQSTAGDILHDIMVQSLEKDDGSMAVKDADKPDANWEML